MGVVRITLSDAQVGHVLREVAGERGLAGLLYGLGEVRLPGGWERDLDEKQISRSVVRALLVFSVFPADGGALALTSVARRLGFSPSTTHRYANTLVLVGLLVRDPKTRRYSRPTREHRDAG